MVQIRGVCRAAAASLSSQPQWWLFLLIVFTSVLRLGSLPILHTPLESDFLAYFNMAKSLAEFGDMRDTAGLQAFYSAGYPLFLTPLFIVFGAKPVVANIANVFLGALATTLLYFCAKEVAKNSIVALIAVAIFIFCPATYVYNSYLAKENLSTPILLGQVLFLLRLLRERAQISDSAIFGFLSGLQALTGPSAILVGLLFIPIAAIIWRRRSREGAYHCASTLLAVVVVLVPWLFYTESILGKPVLNTNSGFNLYIGNNPAATGMFVSISDTPVGSTWQDDLRRKGELRQMSELRERAIDYILSHPSRAAVLAIKKLALFWTPPFHEGRDGNQSHAETVVRTIWGIHYLFVVCLFLFYAFHLTRWSGEKKVLISSIVLFWIAHGPFYVVFRYREPVMPLVIIAASCGFGLIIEKWLRSPWRRAIEKARI